MKNLLLLLVFTLTMVTGFGQNADLQHVFKVFNPPQFLQSEKTAESSYLSNRQSLNNFSKPGLESVYSWNSNAWQHFVDIHHVYDGAGNEIEEVITEAVTNQLLLRRSSVYNSANQLIGELEQDWNGINWVDFYKSVATYDSFGNLVSNVGVQWTGASWDTVGGERHVYKYNGSGYVIEDIFMDWDSVWTPVRKVVPTPGLNGEWIDFTGYLWENGAWTPNQKVVNIVWHNFSVREPEQFTLQYYDSTGWADAEKYTATYSANDCYTAITQIKNSVVSWENQSKLTVNYDSHGNFLGFLYDVWMFNHWSFMMEQHFLLTYDSNQNLIESIRQWRDLNAPAVYLNELKKVYGEYPTTTAVSAEVPEIDLNIWPNPTVNSLFVSLNLTGSASVKIELTDLAGRVFNTTSRSLSQNSPLEIQMQEYPAGIYILTIETAAGIIERKIVKQ